MSQTDKKKWNERYRKTDAVPYAAQVLRENQHLLPSKGKALEVACGLGGNALLLAERGLDVVAYDISDVAVQRLTARARDQSLPLTAEVRDVTANPPPVSAFHVIVVSRFLERDLVTDLVKALLPGGLLFYQTFTRIKMSDAGPSNPAYRLGDNELLTLFSDLQILAYREEGVIGNATQGFRDEAMLIGMQRKRQT